MQTQEDTWQATAQDKHRVLVRFSVRAVKTEKLNEAGELVDVWQDVEYIEKQIPGERDRVDRPVKAADKKEFAAAYRAFKEGLDRSASGMPIEELPGITASEAAMLRYHEVRSVEDLAGLTDSALQNITHGNKLKKRAMDYIAARQGAAPAMGLRAELDKRDTEIAVLKRQNEEMNAKLNELLAKKGK